MARRIGNDVLAPCVRCGHVGLLHSGVLSRDQATAPRSLRPCVWTGWAKAPDGRFATCDCQGFVSARADAPDQSREVPTDGA